MNFASIKSEQLKA